MKSSLVKISLLVILLLGAFSGSTFSQATAVMKVSVRIISGAEAVSEEQTTTFNDGRLAENSELKRNSLSLTAAPYTEVNVYVNEETVLRNHTGRSATFHTHADHQPNPEAGTHQVSFSNKLQNQSLLEGRYQGNVKAVIEYL